MLIYSSIFIAGVLFGIFCYWLFDKKIQITISRKDNNINNRDVQITKSIKKVRTEPKEKLSKSDKYYKSTCLINEIKINGKLPCEISPAVLHSLTIISKTPNWEEQLDDESLQNLNRIYDKWQRFLRANKASTSHAGEAINMEIPKYWEGTEEEYIIALEQGIIDENTKVEIITDDKDYHGSWITRNADGSVTEYMD